MSDQRSLARNVFHLVLGQASTMLLGILFSAALGRTLGAGDFGMYFLISSFATFALVVVDWGQQYFGIREVARSPDRGGALLGTGLVLRSVGIFLAALLTAAATWAFGYDHRTTVFAVTFVILNLPFFLAQNFGIVFRGHDRMGLDATVSVTNRAAGLVLALTALWAGWGLGGVVATQGLAGAVALLVATRLYRRVPSGAIHFSRPAARQILLGGTAIVTMTIAVSVQPYIDVLVLSALVPPEALGWYGAARNIMGTLFAPSLILSAAAYPRLSRAAGDTAAFRQEMEIAQHPMIWMGGLAGVGTWLFAEVAVNLIYGHQHFGPAGLLLRSFGPGLFVVFIDGLLASALLAMGRATAFSVLKISTVVLATAMELFLVPHFQQRIGNGGLGVVSAYVACEVVVFTGMLFMLRKTLGRSLLLDCARALGSAVFTAALLRFLPLNPWLAIPICVVVYGGATMAVGLLRPSHLRALARALAREVGGAEPGTAGGTLPVP